MCWVCIRCFALCGNQGRLIELATDKGHEACREDARELMRQIQEKNVEYDAERKVCYLQLHFSLMYQFLDGISSYP
jgi:hypothetical protein